jgi:hypothetical protein
MALPAIAAAVKMASAFFFHMVFSFPAGSSALAPSRLKRGQSEPRRLNLN